ncbi:MAG: 4Fe-4S binding protein [Deltaproteobacteria bacterium]|nr:4Fe-4S binding protein [Deltaproteobacteria bacterium]
MADGRIRFLPSRLRFLCQNVFAFYCLFIGYRFYLFFVWATENGHYTPRPPSVEAFLPIGALLSLKQFILTHRYDPIHPAGLTIFIAVLVVSFLFRKGFCGWICPIGFASELLNTMGRHAAQLFGHGTPRHGLLRTPAWLEYPLLLLKYLLLGFFCYLILWKMDLAALEQFSRSPYSLTADGRMLLFFFHPSRLTLIVILCLLGLSLVFRNFWCRYLCPYGALLGLPAMVSPLQVARDKTTCIDCKKCEDICPSSLPITAKTLLRSPECIGCLECVSHCPRKDCLTLASPFAKKLPPLALPAGLLTVFLTIWLAAEVTGHWHSAIPDDTLRHYYQTIK